MPRRTTRYFGPEQSQALLVAISECRRECVVALTAAPIRGPVYLAVERVMDAMDDLAGDRTHFHAKPHSTP